MNGAFWLPSVAYLETVKSEFFVVVVVKARAFFFRIKGAP
jgi:hypothetical protein